MRLIITSLWTVWAAYLTIAAFKAKSPSERIGHLLSVLIISTTVWYLVME